MSATKFDIEKFDRNASFALWQVKMRAILTQNGLHKALEMEKLPDTVTADQRSDLDQKALTAIQLCLSNEVLREVRSEKTTKDLWSKLESLYIKKNLTTKLVAKHRLHMLTMSEGTSLKSHVDDFGSILMDLENMDINYEEEDKALMLLRSLPPSYKHFRETIIVSKATLTLEDVKSALFSKELMDKELSSRVDAPAEGLMVRGRSFDRNSASSSKNKSRSKSRHRNLIVTTAKRKGTSRRTVQIEEQARKKGERSE